MSVLERPKAPLRVRGPDLSVLGLQRHIYIKTICLEWFEVGMTNIS